MNGDDKSADGFPKTRPVLGDVTNQLGKRGLLLISSNSRNKFGGGHGKHVDDNEGDSQFTQKVCQGVENIVKEKCGIRCVVNDNDKSKRACVSPPPCSEINSLRGNIISGISKIPSEIKEPNSFNGGVHIARNNAIIDNVVEVVDASRNSCLSSILIPVASESCAVVEGNCSKDEERVTPEVAQSNPRGEEFVAHVCKKDGKDVGADNPTLGKHGSVECSRLPESQGSGYFKLDKCIGLKGNGSSNSSAGVDLIKACSCSFCVKAAYIWSDLHYQDIKGRIAALKKSQKEASLMVERSCRGKGIDKHSQENCPQSSKLESDLMSQWRSLFLHMEDILVRESSQLETSLLTLKDVRERCKTEMEVINGMPSEKD
ncbi:uncharacterized protein LOC130768523 isoform X1 [Actinidia eriantha]|uniref:uncharacterized protein LOC130768523 isoform X1 n=1 Tax=Actinidia eriantha TaxID=165200 RepID=UPI0025889DDA|nr:uncharacterized protein LOC130768523 isoform X1 [Actinidia eriantha]